MDSQCPVCPYKVKENVKDVNGALRSHFRYELDVKKSEDHRQWKETEKKRKKATASEESKEKARLRQQKRRKCAKTEAEKEQTISKTVLQSKRAALKRKIESEILDIKKPSSHGPQPLEMPAVLQKDLSENPYFLLQELAHIGPGYGMERDRSSYERQFAMIAGPPVPPLVVGVTTRHRAAHGTRETSATPMANPIADVAEFLVKAAGRLGTLDYKGMSPTPGAWKDAAKRWKEGSEEDHVAMVAEYEDWIEAQTWEPRHQAYVRAVKQHEKEVIPYIRI
jgi:hypothetical protein